MVIAKLYDITHLRVPLLIVGRKGDFKVRNFIAKRSAVLKSRRRKTESISAIKSDKERGRRERDGREIKRTSPGIAG